MLDLDGMPHILTPLDLQTERHTPALYSQIIRRTLKKILPDNFFTVPNPEQNFPHIFCTPMIEVPSTISFYFVMKSRPNAFKFFYEMISHWLIPGTRLNVLLIYNVDFRMPEISSDLFNLCEVMIRVEDPKHLDQIQKNYPIIESEIAIGLRSAYYAHRILEIKGLSVDEKTGFIQEQIAYITEKFPSIFDQTIFTEMQHVLMLSTEEFKSARETRHLSRLVCLHYIFRKQLRELIKLTPQARYQKIKIFHAKIGGKHVIGVMAGINFIREKEMFEQRHLLKAIHAHMPGVKAVENSYFYNRRGSEPITTLYLEIEKISGEPFTSQEFIQLKNDLPKDLSHHIEDLLPPVFMPRNDEEIMRNIMSLSNQLKFAGDLPQLVISFDNQTHNNLYFTVILVRILNKDHRTIKEIFEQGNTFIEYIHDRSRKLGIIRKKYPKDATVFHVKFNKENFIRIDHSIDLSRARHAIVSEITRLLGPVRDYNGGMITKQTELLSSLKALLKQETIRYNDWMLENFFYSLSPPMMRAVLDPRSLKILFMLMLTVTGHKEGGEGTIKMTHRDDSIYILITTPNGSLKEELHKVVNHMSMPNLSTVSTYVKIQEVNYLGFIFHSIDLEEREKFAQAIAAAAAPSLANRDSLPAR